MITCPNCEARSREVMPKDACQHFYRCAGCG
ncbi:MAG: GDCCVxC domain-containing (seleno)protein [Acidimicrobiales bacterium]